MFQAVFGVTPFIVRTIPTDGGRRQAEGVER